MDKRKDIDTSEEFDDFNDRVRRLGVMIKDGYSLHLAIKEVFAVSNEVAAECAGQAIAGALVWMWAELQGWQHSPE